ncbi:glutamate synthase large subunit [Terrilactibacillus laevilacticus]|uniref:glutamate synthase large subunit n=1 Tax=Terrilactibacillus laevilacticus TaxID=1380157 RepID=UPI0011462C38|nr:glutamate synthase large subunit [Terrilactibacillus laevilacticus]
MKDLLRQNGLYQSEFEHDACGIGLYADIKGRASHDIVETALEMLARLDHRAGKGSDGTGDGAGLLVQIPHDFFNSVCSFSLPEAGQYGVGMLFLPQDSLKRRNIIKTIKSVISEKNYTLYGIREVPVLAESIEPLARQEAPYIIQLFVGVSDQLTDSLEYQLYTLRKTLEQRIGKELYIASLSSKTIVFKGMLRAEEVSGYYTDLKDERFVSAIALVHSRFSTNTFPSWKRAHPNRMIVHNGEINTIRGNANWFNARAKTLDKDYGNQIIDRDGSDSAIFDNVLEFLTMNGVPLAHAIMLMVPEPWEKDKDMPDSLKAFYEYNSRFMEPWDGPMALGFSNGKQVGAIMDRNGLRPARYYVTHDDRLIFSSEVGVVDLDPSLIKEKRHLKPGHVLLVDTERGQIVPSDELKKEISEANEYAKLLEKSIAFAKSSLGEHQSASYRDRLDRLYLQKVNGYTYEEVVKGIQVMAETGKEPVGSMGYDAPLAVLSERPQLLFNYFKQWFSQVTNPPIDAIREEHVISKVTWLGKQPNILEPTINDTKQIKLEHPILDESQFATIQNGLLPVATLNLTFNVNDGKTGLKQALVVLFQEAEAAIKDGNQMIILSDRDVDAEHAPIPSLLAVSGLHHDLIKKGLRTSASIVVDSAEPRDSHHMSALLGFGADAIYPYMAFEVIKDLIKDEHLNKSEAEASQKYVKALVGGIVKVMSKVGISAIQSYRGAQTFEVLGLSKEVIDQYFTGTFSQIDGIGLEEIADETLKRHAAATKEWESNRVSPLDPGSDLQWRQEGEFHKFNPMTIYKLQQAARKNDYGLYQEYKEEVDDSPYSTIRSLLEIKNDRQPVPLDEVEPAESIFKRFKTGAMSYGSISKEAHEALAIAMNRIGGKSNSGEGGEEVERFTLDSNGENRRSAIKQVASARFGVTSHYLSEANEIQIKMAQGAKPGEGGQLPAHKVYPWIAEVRGATPGVGLISPPPHHDIYSIEDLAQLIYDLKRANPTARISVKLVAKAGVGTIAAGVAKGLADVILISGHDGGTGAASKSSIAHAGIPWEIGLAEAHQTLLLNGLRNRVSLEVDGKLMSGKDVIVAACLGAEEFGFATAPLAVLGCIMMRACHLDTCPVGIATQNPELRKNFTGSPDHIVNYMHFIAEDIREILSQNGFRSLEEVVGHAELLKVKDSVQNHPKASHLDLSKMLVPTAERDEKCNFTTPQNHELDKTYDFREILPQTKAIVERGETGQFNFNIKNSDRSVGTTLGYTVTTSTNGVGFEEDALELQFNGYAGQSFGAFVPKGITMTLTGDANDYVGKGLSGGKLIIKPNENDGTPDDNQAIVGNVAFFGATSGEAYVRGTAGVRFCVRNSGAKVVIEGIGDNGCEYMTGGKAIILGHFGKNFAAGMSGGTAYLFNESGDYDQIVNKVNKEMVNIETIVDPNEQKEVKELIENYAHYTGSPKAEKILLNWEESVTQFVKIIPKDYELMLSTIKKLESQGLSHDEATQKAFELKKSGRITLDHGDPNYQPA